ncbi:mitochondrial enolase superfamily member 1 [Grus japonensis]|uniref:Mitochondrial enolase superfamily member 1 n=1 Tax=Grus japonensis TaxID=30415 RepID=A0ABC9VZK4_GRUJA
MIWMMVQHALSKFADDTKLGGMADMPESCDAIQRNHNKLEKWANRHLPKFNKWKYKVLHLGRNNPRHQSIPGAAQLESSFSEKHLGILVDTQLNISQQCALAAKKVNGMTPCPLTSIGIGRMPHTSSEMT